MKNIITVLLNLSLLFSGPSLFASSNWQEMQLKKSLTSVFDLMHSENDMIIKRNRIMNFISDIENALEKSDPEDEQVLALKSKIANYNKIIFQIKDHDLDDLAYFIEDDLEQANFIVFFLAIFFIMSQADSGGGECWATYHLSCY